MTLITFVTLCATEGANQFRFDDALNWIYTIKWTSENCSGKCGDWHLIKYIKENCRKECSAFPWLPIDRVSSLKEH